jgi:predicted O-linked N-acetylglucosamine transferase (SPINDLY family)
MIDICIDTFPYAGTTTTFESLSMGVPVVTLRAAHSNHAHNVGVAILSRMEGATDLIADTEQEYIAIAVKLSQDPGRLLSLRRTLRQTLLQSPLCDAPTFVQGLESTYQQLWRKKGYRRDSSSGDIEVPSQMGTFTHKYDTLTELIKKIKRT